MDTTGDLRRLFGVRAWAVVRIPREGAHLIAAGILSASLVRLCAARDLAQFLLVEHSHGFALHTGSPHPVASLRRAKCERKCENAGRSPSQFVSRDRPRQICGCCPSRPRASWDLGELPQILRWFAAPRARARAGTARTATERATDGLSGRGRCSGGREVCAGLWAYLWAETAYLQKM